MKNIPSAHQTKLVDQHCITTEPISSIDLMERASEAFCTQFIALNPQQNSRILICCGTGNNGGDGLAIARILRSHGYRRITVWIVYYNKNKTADFNTNLERLAVTDIPIVALAPDDTIPEIHADIIIDALLGSGLNKPISGAWLRLVQHINDARKNVYAVDVPSGFPCDGPFSTDSTCITASTTISFQRPKASFFFPESQRALNEFHTVSIGLNEAYIEGLNTEFKLVDEEAIKQLYRPRLPFSHKGTYGHALIMAGSTDTMGAALLCSAACLYSGAGLTTACIPESGLTALNTKHPEIMYASWHTAAKKWEQYSAIAIGPGLGERTSELLIDIAKFPKKPLVLDADALNILAQNKDLWISLLPGNILSPHMKEFDRLFGIHENWWKRVETARKQAQKYQCIIVLKNRYSFIAAPNGIVYINPTGNPAMASGGMGDVLTGMITAFLAQGYDNVSAAILACYLHGATGDALLASYGMAVIPAQHIIKEIPKVMGRV